MTYLAIFIVCWIVYQLALTFHMHNIMKWQEHQDKEILYLMDARKKDLEKQISHMQVSLDVCKAFGNLLEILEKREKSK